jgi:hypothetical protein
MIQAGATIVDPNTASPLSDTLVKLFLAVHQDFARLQPNPALRKRDILQLIWRNDQYSNDYLKLLLAGSRVEFNWKRGQIVYKPENDFERAVYALFLNSSLAKVCGNPDCPARFFVAQRKSQRYCDADCAAVFQHESKRNWWKEVGSKMRRQQRAEKRKAKKGR